MPSITKDLIVLQTDIRFFYQLGGTCPGNTLKYAGQDGQYMNIESATNPIRSIDPIHVQDPKKGGRFRRVGRNRSAPDLPTASVMFLQRRGYLPTQSLKMRVKPVTFYAIAGGAKDLTDFLNGWEHYIKIMSQGEVTEPTENMSAWDSGEQVEDELNFTFDSIYSIGPITFSEKAAATVYSEVKDVAYGELDDGTVAVYAVCDNTIASPGQAPAVYYRTTEGGSFTELAITGAVSTDVPQAIVVMGQYLIVVFDNGTTGGYFYAAIDSDTGVPGTFTKVTTGFVTAKAPKDIYAPDARSIFFVGEGGYIYKSTNITAGVSVLDAGVQTTNQLNRIAGKDEVLVAVGESDTIVYSKDRGRSWSTPTNVSGGGNGLDAVEVVDNKVWWVGDDGGDAYYTTDGGKTAWTNAGLPATVATVQDIVFPTDEVGFIATATSGPAAVIYTTFDGGNTWTATTPRLGSIGTHDRINRIAIPESPENAIRANYLACGGLAGNGSDGVILIGEPVSL